MTLYIDIYRYIDNEEPQNLFIPHPFFQKSSVISYYIKGYTLSMGNKIDIVVV